MCVYLVLQSQVEEGGRSRGVALAITCISLLQSLFQRVYRVVWGWEMHTRPQHISVNGDCNPQFLSGLITFKITHFAGISYFQISVISGSFRLVQFRLVQFSYKRVILQGQKYSVNIHLNPQINSIFSEQKAHHRIHYGTYGLLYGDESGCKTIFQGAYGSV